MNSDQLINTISVLYKKLKCIYFMIVLKFCMDLDRHVLHLKCKNMYQEKQSKLKRYE